MSTSKKNPAAAPAGAADRVEDIVALGSNSDHQTITSNIRETPEVRLLALRYGLSPTIARVICELAGIGGVR
jgi:hypothetical protein